MHKVAILDDQEQLHPHVKTYCIFTASILISVCTHAAAILDGQLEQLCPHAQIYCIFTASILISVCAHAVAILEGQHPCTNILSWPSNSGPGNSNSGRFAALQPHPGRLQAFPVLDSHPRCNPWSKLFSDLLPLLHLSVYPSLTLLHS